MKIAVSSTAPGREAPVSPIFGRCACFVVVDTETQEAVTLENPALGAAGGAGIQSAQHIVRQGVDAALRQRQPVEEGGGRAARFHLGDILGIGSENFFRVAADRPLDRLQRPVLLLGRRQRQHPRSRASALGQFGHQGRQVGGAVDGFQGGGHGSLWSGVRAFF